MSGLLAALQFLTRLPVPAEPYPLESGLVWFPLVGLLLGALLALADAGLRWLSVPALLASAVLVVLLLGLSGALHADGLMDACDGVFGHATPERRLEIMRDPRVGAFGVIGLVSVVLLKVAAIDALGVGGSARMGLLVLAPALGRWAIVLVATVFPYGRPTGLGAPLKAATSPVVLLIATLLPVAACVVLGPSGWIAGALAALVAVGLGRWFMTLLPGLTGDCYGAVCEVVETVVWVGGAVVLT